MSDDKLVPRPTYRAPVKQRLIMLPIIIWMLVGILQTAGDMSGFRFLSSPDWFDRSFMWSWIAAAVLAPLSAWCVLVGIRAQEIAKGETRSPTSVRLHLLCGLLVGAGLGGESVSSGVPMVVAMVAGTRTEMEVTVREVASYRTMECGYKVRLEGLGMFGHICGMSEEKRSRLSPGDRLTVVGRGTWRGVFVDEVLLTANQDRQQHLSF